MAENGRLIPAHAGKTSRPRLRSRRARAHPRSRGENLVCAQEGQGSGGSSPLTRGKRSTHDRRRTARRLIPAHAGKTRPPPVSQSKPGAHPRSRGENPGQLGTGIVGAGSSPLTRGKRVPVISHTQVAGLIPAHAGKTQAGRPAWARRPAHPRSRGENTRYWCVTSRRGGSSPLTRGKPADDGVVCGFGGLIPAHAGKTHAGMPTRPCERAHPRSRGENGCCGQGFRLDLGSSPLTRGKPFLRCGCVS